MYKNIFFLTFTLCVIPNVYSAECFYIKKELRETNTKLRKVKDPHRRTALQRTKRRLEKNLQEKCKGRFRNLKLRGNG